MVPDEARKLVLSGAVPDNQNFMRRLQCVRHRRQIGLAVMRVAGAHRSGLVVDISVAILRLESGVP